MSKSVIGLTLALCLLVAPVTPALAQQTPKPLPVNLTATVTVNSFVSILLTDNGEAGIVFPGTNPGASSAVGDRGQDSTMGAVTITVQPETNADVILQVQGSSADFVGNTSPPLPLTSVTWSKSYAGTRTPMSTSAATVQPVNLVDANKTVNIWHWLTVPSGTKAGTYTATFTYKAT